MDQQQKREQSCGVVVFRREGSGVSYLLLRKGVDYWNFPKGRQEPGESEKATALREAHEESGITDIALIDGFEASYDYDFDKVIEDGARQTIYKHDIFFLGETKATDVAISSEHMEAGWFDYDVALKRIPHQNIRDVLIKAHQFLLKQQNYVL